MKEEEEGDNEHVALASAAAKRNIKVYLMV